MGWEPPTACIHMLPAKIITWRQPCHPLHLGGVGVLIREFSWGGTGQGLSQLFTQAPRPLPAASGLSISPSSHVQGSNFHRPQQWGLVRPVKDLGPDDMSRTREWLCLRSQGLAAKEITLLLPIATAWCGEQPARAGYHSSRDHPGLIPHLGSRCSACRLTGVGSVPSDQPCQG